MEEQDKAKEHIKDVKEWQNNMYSPGKYLGDKLPPMLKWGNRKFIKSYIWFVIAIVLLALVTLVFSLEHPTILFRSKNVVSNNNAVSTKDIPSDYLNSNYRVIGVFQNNQPYTSANTPDLFINQVQVAVATIRQGDPSSCGSLTVGEEVERPCYFFIEPLFYYPPGIHTSYLGELPLTLSSTPGQLRLDSIKFKSPDNVEFETDAGEGGCSYIVQWQLNLHSGQFKQLSNIHQGCDGNN